ncbi:Tify domain binding domain [Dillenia turbinata]|uniref:Tify domain binding domain n=1 Tax=Dillenia turbinata TaxID=194707 RepID=A0AAN8VNR8_9MAGN
MATNDGTFNSDRNTMLLMIFSTLQLSFLYAFLFLLLFSEITLVVSITGHSLGSMTIPSSSNKPPYEMRGRGTKRSLAPPSSPYDDDSAKDEKDEDYKPSPSRGPKRRHTGNGVDNVNRGDVNAVEVEGISTGPRRNAPIKRGSGYGEVFFGHVPRGIRERGRSANSSKWIHYAGGSSEIRRRTIISWLVEVRVIGENDMVVYLNKGRQWRTLEGKISNGGIVCGCCQRTVTVPEFELHAGGDTQKPYSHIILQKNGMTLLQSQVQAWNQIVAPNVEDFHLVKPQATDGDPYDDACMICADGGALLCCTKCPSTFHLSCVGLEVEPQGDWLCPHCICKYCGASGDSQELFTCAQCMKKYHYGCSHTDDKPLDLNGSPHAFCGDDCKVINDKLERLNGEQIRLPEGFSWTLLRRNDLDQGGYGEAYHKRALCNSKLAVAWSILDECFKPIKDRQTKINVTKNVVFHCSSNFMRINFFGFYTAILEKDDEIISAACVRLHGPNFAEMPFIATAKRHRQKGMCRKLLCALDLALFEMRIDKLVIPSAPERVGVWKKKFSFEPVDDDLMRVLTKTNSLMFFSSKDITRANSTERDQAVNRESSLRGPSSFPTVIFEEPETIKTKKSVRPTFNINLNMPAPEGGIDINAE